MSNLLSIPNITKTWSKDQPSIVLNYLTIEQNSLTILTGINGVGKSTILNILTGNVEADNKLTITFNNKPKSKLLVGKDVTYLPQEPYLFDTTVINNLTFVLKTNQRSLDEAEQILEIVGIPPNQYKENANNLSGGMKKRLSLAQIYATNAPLVLLDEPTNDLDQEGLDTLQKLFTKMIDNNKAIFTALPADKYPSFNLNENIINLD